MSIKPSPNELLQVSIIGQVIGGTHIAGSGSAHCNWKLVASSGWKHKQGALTGASQSDAPEEANMFVWQHPVDAQFECDAAQAQDAWPRLELEVRWRDGFDRSDIAGYGVVTVPPSPGVHKLVCRLWQPCGGSFGEQFRAFFLGGRPALKNESLIFGIAEEMENGGTQLARAAGHHRLTTQPAGTVHISLAVVMQRREKPAE